MSRVAAAEGDLWVGVDLGTQSVKAVVVDDVGTVVGHGSSPLTSIRSPGRHEQDPHEWVGAATEALKAALAPLADDARSRVRRVAICATSGTIAVVDDEGSPRGPGLMYDDVRAGSLADEVQLADEQLWRRLGYRIQPSWALPKILWLIRQGLLPDRGAAAGSSKATAIAHQADVVASAMTGHRVPTDWSHALKSGYDTLNGTWPEVALARLGVAPGLLPDVVAPGSVIGETSTAWADSTGLPAGTAVVAGMTDGCAAQISAGTLRAGDWHTVVGTTLVVKTVSDSLVRDDAGAVYSHRSPEADLWFPGGASNVGAGALSTLFPGMDLTAATDRVAVRFAGRTNEIPIAYPLTGVGERFPVTAPKAEGFVLLDGGAVSLDAARESLDDDALLAGVLLGIAHVELLCMRVLEKAGSPVTGTVSSSGGATRNPWWMQLRADLLGRDIAMPRTSEGALGMAVLAAWSAQRGETLAEVATRLSPTGHVVASSSTGDQQLQASHHRFVGALRAEGWDVP